MSTSMVTSTTGWVIMSGRVKRGISIMRRVGGISEVEAVDFRDVDPAHGGDRGGLSGAHRWPAVASHLLGSDELGGAPDTFGSGSSMIRVVPSRSAMHNDRPDTYATRVPVGSGRGSNTAPSAWISCAAPVRRFTVNNRPRDRERSHRGVGVRRVRDNAARLLAGALPARPLVRGELGVGVGEQVGGCRRHGSRRRCRRRTPTARSPDRRPAPDRTNTTRVAVAARRRSCGARRA